VWRRARTRGSESEFLIEVAYELLIEVTCELLIEVDLEKIDGSGWCQERDRKYQHITPRRARRKHEEEAEEALTCTTILVN
jgi:hypothetical protein